jgi:uncharacterized protein
MGFSLFPKTPKFYNLFLEQNSKMVQAAALLHEVFSDFTDITQRCKKIIDLELEGNTASGEITRALSLTFITPIDREDIHEINMAQEDVTNLIKAISTRIGLYGFKEVKAAAIHLLGNLKAMVQETGNMLNQLSKKKEVEKHSKVIKALKGDSDMVLLVALGELYEQQLQGYEAVLDIIKWTQIYDRIEEAVGRTEYLANTIEGIVLKNA